MTPLSLSWAGISTPVSSNPKPSDLHILSSKRLCIILRSVNWGKNNELILFFNNFVYNVLFSSNILSPLDDSLLNFIWCFSTLQKQVFLPFSTLVFCGAKVVHYNEVITRAVLGPKTLRPGFCFTDWGLSSKNPTMKLFQICSPLAYDRNKMSNKTINLSGTWGQCEKSPGWGI